MGDIRMRTVMTPANYFRQCLALVAAVSMMTAGCRRGDDTSTQTVSNKGEFPIEHLGRFYQANSMIEMDQDKAAGKLLDALLGKIGREPAVLANLAITKLSESQNDAALKLATEAFEAAPDNVDVALIRVAAIRAGGSVVEAITLSEEIVKQHPDDVRSHWTLIQCMEMTAHLISDGSYGLNQRVALLRVAPTNLAALLSAARVAAQSGDATLADQYIRRALALIPETPENLRASLDQLDDAVARKDMALLQSIVVRTRNLMLATDRYKADVIALGSTADQSPAPVRHPIWRLTGDPSSGIAAKIRFEKVETGTLIPPVADNESIRRIVVGSVSADRSPALTLIDAVGRLRILLRRDGAYVDATKEAGLADAPPCIDVAFLDLNNDKRMDLLLSSDSGDRYYVQSAAQRFDDVTSAIGLTGASNGAKPFDYDNDGDLDLLRWDASRLYLDQNDGEGALTRIESRPGLPMDIANIQSIRTLDLDDDGDVDLFITSGDGPYSIHVISNERLASFRDVTTSLALVQRTYVAPPAVADMDNDGWLELIDVTFGSRIAFGPEFAMKSVEGLFVEGHPASAAIADYDNNGKLDAVFVRGGGQSNREDIVVSAGSTLLPVDLDWDGCVDLISSHGEAFLNKTENGGNWLRVSLVGLNTGDSRFNALGLGSTIELRSGSLYQKRHVESGTTHFGLGPYSQADVMRVVWPNGNYQNLEYRANSAIALAANRTIVEEQTLKGSCPYLYVWNGERFVFATDVLWRSALGMSIMQGVYGHHGTADDYFKIDGDRLIPRDGAYWLSFTEELWETSYFDYCRLLVIDHPAGTSVYADEKCLMPPYPPFEILQVREARQPLSATDERGRDVLAELALLDGRYVDDFEQTRYQGLVEPHDLILDLGAFDQYEAVRLFLQGWLWPTDASTNVAVSQNPKVSPDMPRIQVIAEDGSWIDADVVVGFPSGKSKTIAVDLTGEFRNEDHRVRLQTNFCIYWDRVFYTIGDQDFELRTTQLEVDRAELKERGISFQYPLHPGGPRIPEYDALDRAAQWRDLIGGYTPLGDVTQALSTIDDDYVIVGAGDEVLMWFDAASVPEPPDGWVRDFIVHTDGWLKDGDLNSATGKTVEPLPWHGMPGYPVGAEPSDAHEKIPPHARNRDQRPFRARLRPLTDSGR